MLYLQRWWREGRRCWNGSRQPRSSATRFIDHFLLISPFQLIIIIYITTLFLFSPPKFLCTHKTEKWKHNIYNTTIISFVIYMAVFDMLKVCLLVYASTFARSLRSLVFVVVCLKKSIPSKFKYNILLHLVRLSNTISSADERIFRMSSFKFFMDFYFLWWGTQRFYFTNFVNFNWIMDLPIKKRNYARPSPK